MKALTGSINISPELVSQIFNIAFFAIIGLIVIGFLLGLIKGIWKSAFHLIFMGLLVVGSFFAARYITDYLAQVDLGQMLGGFGVTLPEITLNINETPIVLQITSIQETIASLFDQLLPSLGIDSSAGAEMSSLIVSVTLVIVRYVVFIMLGFIVMIIGPVLASALYFFPFRFIIPKNWRKKRKLRLVGGLLNSVKVTLVGVMLIIPFSSIINTINQAFHNENNGVATGIDDPTYNQIMSFMNAYNDSIFAQALFNWSVNDQGKTLDTQLMDFVTGEKINDTVFNISTELYTIASIGQTVLSTGVLSGAGQDALMATFLSEEVVGSILTNIFSSTLIMKVVPLAISLALNLEQVSAFVDPSLIDLNDIDWQLELNNVKDVALDIISSGILDEVLGEEGDLDPINLIVSMVNDEVYPSIRSALHRIDDSQLLSQLLPAVVYKLVDDELNSETPVEGFSFSTFFPSEWEDYQQLRFGEEIALIYDVIHDVAAIDPDLLPTLLEVAMSGGGGDQEEAQPFNPNEYHLANHGSRKMGAKNNGILKAQTTEELFIDLMKDYSEQLIAIIVGEIDNSGLPVGVDPETGKTIIRDDEGQLIEGVSANLLDSGLLIYGLDTLLELALNPLLETFSSGNFDQQKLDDTIELLNGEDNGEKRFNYKGEFGAILKIAAAIFSNEDLAGLFFPSADDDGEDAKSHPFFAKDNHILRAEDEESALMDIFNDEAFRQGFKDDVCPLLDRSKIFGAVLPSVLEGALTDPSMSDMFDQIGIDVNTLNFDFTDVGTQLAIVIDIIGYGLNVVDNVETMFDDFAPLADDLIGLLDSIFISSIINPKDDDGNMTSDNYYGMINKLFAQAESFNMDADDLDAAARSVPQNGWVTVYDDDGVVTFQGENYNLIKFIETALTTELFDIDSSGDVLDQMISFAEDPDDPIGRIFDAVDSSIIISSTFGGVVDNLFGSSGDIVDPDIGTSFTNVDNWSEEGANLKYILISLKPFATGIENIDFINDDPENIENILKGLAQSQIFIKADDEYVFSDFLFKKLTAGSILGSYLYDPYEDGTSLNPYDTMVSDMHAIGQTRATKQNWYQDDGEIDKIVDFVRELQDFADGDPNPLDKIIGSAGNTADELRPILVNLNEVASLRIAVYNLFNDLFGTDQFDIGSLNLGETNTYIFIQLNDIEDRKEQINHAFDVYASLETLTLNQGGSFSMDSFDEETVEEIENLLNSLHDAKLFNTFDTSFEDRSYLTGFTTVFEQAVNMIYSESTFETYIYKDLATPAEQHQALKEDIMSLDNNFANTGIADDWSGPTGEIKNITNIFISLKKTALSFDDLGNDATDSFANLLDDAPGLTKVENLLLDINHSLIAYPAVPNLFDEVFKSTDINVAGLDFDAANTHYRGNRGDGTLDDKYLPYDDTEISNILVIFQDLKAIATVDYTDLSSLGNDKIDDIKHVAESFFTSNVFHQTGSSTGNLNDPTVFEQIMIKMINDTGLSDLIDDTNNPNPNYYDLGIYKFVNAAEKVDYLVINYETLYETDLTYHTHSWDGDGGEIDNFFRIFKEIKRVMPAVDQVASLDPATLDPEVIEALFASLNYANLTADAVPDLIRQAFDAISFDNYTEGHQNYYISPVAYFEKDLTTMDYSLTDHDLVPPIAGSKGIIIGLLDEFYVGGSFEDMGAGFAIDTFVDNGHSLKPLIHLLDASKIFTNDIIGKTYKTRSLTFYNILQPSDIVKYIDWNNPLTSRESKINKLETIFASDFEYVFESARLDAFVSTLVGFASLSDASNISGLGPQFRSIVDNTYLLDSGIIVDRAYLVSELAAGFLSDIFDPQYIKAPQADFIDFYVNDYGKLNPLEADGIDGALSVLGIMDKIVDLTYNQNDIDNLAIYFAMMGSLANTNVADGPYPIPYDYTSYDEDGNSSIARLFYASEVVNSGTFDFNLFATGVHAYALINQGDPNVWLENDPYDTNFVFEIEGDKIAYTYQ